MQENIQQNQEASQNPTTQKTVQQNNHRPKTTKQGKKPLVQAKQSAKPLIQAKQKPVKSRHKPVQRKLSKSEQIAHTMGQQYGVDTSSLQITHNSSFPGKVNAEATIQGSKIDFAPGKDTEHNIKHEVGHFIDNAKNGTPKGDKVVNGQTVDTTREKVADKIADTPLQQKSSSPIGLQSPTNPSSLVQRSPVRMSTAGPVQRVRIEPEDRTHHNGDTNGFDALVHTPIWHREAEAFEQRLGVKAANDNRARQAVQAALQKMKKIFKEVYGDDDGVYDLFGLENSSSDKKSSSGQVHDDRNTLMQVVDDKTILGNEVDDVNLREKMTAFYNAAYFGKGYGDNIKLGLKKILQEITLNDKEDITDKQDIHKSMEKSGVSSMKEYAQRLDLDSDSLMEMKEYFEDSFFRSTMSKNNKWGYNYYKDVVSIGNLTNENPLRLIENREMPLSQSVRGDRKPDEQKQKSKTPQDYEDMGVELSPRERKYASYAKRQHHIDDHEKLPWREGISLFNIDENSSWYKEMHNEKGFPLVASISGTTSRMLTIFKWLNTGQDMEAFRLALMGWMLPGRDHSLYEIMRGAEMVGIKNNQENLKDAVLMYQYIAPYNEQYLRDNVGVDGMFPHEKAYVELAESDDKKNGKFLLPGEDGIDTAKRRKQTHDDNNVYSNMNLAHHIVLSSYTGPDHISMNATMGMMHSNGYYKAIFGSLNQKLLSNKKSRSNSGENDSEGKPIVFTKEDQKLLNKFLDDAFIELPEVIEELMDEPKGKWKTIFDAYVDYNTSTPDKRNHANKLLKIETDRLWKQIKPEAKVHMNMLQEALMTLPPWTKEDGTIYVGTWETDFTAWRDTPTVSFDGLQSTSKSRGTAENFAEPNVGKKGIQAVVYEITPKDANGRGRDISSFSQIQGEDEVLFLPGLRLQLSPTDKEKSKDGINYRKAKEI